MEESKKLDKESLHEVVTKWRQFWMNQKQNSEADYKNYLHRATGVDANMKYHLVDLMFEYFNPIFTQQAAELEATRKENDRLLAIKLDECMDDNYKLARQLEKDNSELRDELFVVKRDLESENTKLKEELNNSISNERHYEAIKRITVATNSELETIRLKLDKAVELADELDMHTVHATLSGVCTYGKPCACGLGELRKQLSDIKAGG